MASKPTSGTAVTAALLTAGFVWTVRSAYVYDESDSAFEEYETLFPDTCTWEKGATAEETEELWLSAPSIVSSRLLKWIFLCFSDTTSVLIIAWNSRSPPSWGICGYKRIITVDFR